MAPWGGGRGGGRGCQDKSLGPVSQRRPELSVTPRNPESFRRRPQHLSSRTAPASTMARAPPVRAQHGGSSLPPLATRCMRSSHSHISIDGGLADGDWIEMGRGMPELGQISAQIVSSSVPVRAAGADSHLCPLAIFVAEGIARRMAPIIVGVGLVSLSWRGETRAPGRFPPPGQPRRIRFPQAPCLPCAFS